MAVVKEGAELGCNLDDTNDATIRDIRSGRWYVGLHRNGGPSINSSSGRAPASDVGRGTWDDKYLEMSVLWFQEQEHLRAAEQKVAAVPVDGD